MADVISRNDPGYTDYVINLATGGSMKSGVLNEPRIFYDVIPQNTSSTVITSGTPGVFVNGEQFPIHLTHLTAAQAYLDQTGAVADEQLIQRIGMRLVFHNQFYMNAQFVPVPLWGNKVVAAPDAVTFGNAHWNFVKNGNPFVLSARDTLVVRVRLNDASAPTSGVPVNVITTGFGMLSKRPYLFNSETILTTLQRTNLSTVDLRNDGLEPIVITDITVTVSSEVEDSSPVGIIGRVSLNIMQVSNGTGAWWFAGPQTPVPIPEMQATLLGVTTFYRAWKFDYPRLPRASWTERFVAFRKCMWGLLLILIVLGGIYAGMFTPTEAAAISAVYAFVIAVFVYRDMSLKDVPRVLLGSANMSAMILYIITNAVLFSFLMANENIPQQIAAWITSIGVDWIIFLLIVNVLLLIAGNVMEASSIVLIMAPILFPVAIKLGIHPVHLGILMVVNMEVGMCHPPVGLNLYVASGIAKMGITELTIAVWPWLLTMLIFLGVVTYVPEISLWLPRALGML